MKYILPYFIASFRVKFVPSHVSWEPLVLFDCFFDQNGALLSILISFSSKAIWYAIRIWIRIWSCSSLLKILFLSLYSTWYLSLRKNFFYLTKLYVFFLSHQVTFVSWLLTSLITIDRFTSLYIFCSSWCLCFKSYLCFSSYKSNFFFCNFLGMLITLSLAWEIPPIFSIGLVCRMWILWICLHIGKFFSPLCGVLKQNAPKRECCYSEMWLCWGSV